MTTVTRILTAIQEGDRLATDKLLPLVYDELRAMARQRIADEAPGQTLQGTALVHEAWLRLVGTDGPSSWEGRNHFFAAAAEAMRRILVESARRRASLKRGGEFTRQVFNSDEICAPERCDELLAVDEALDRLEAANPVAARLVKLRYFAGLTIPEVAAHLGISPRKADQVWAYARAWLHDVIGPPERR